MAFKKETEDVSLLEFMYPILIAYMPGGAIVGDWGLCCCVPVIRVRPIVRAILIPFVVVLFYCCCCCRSGFTSVHRSGTDSFF